MCSAHRFSIFRQRVRLQALGFVVSNLLGLTKLTAVTCKFASRSGKIVFDIGAGLTDEKWLGR